MDRWISSPVALRSALALAPMLLGVPTVAMAAPTRWLIAYTDAYSKKVDFLPLRIPEGIAGGETPKRGNVLRMPALPGQKILAAQSGENLFVVVPKPDGTWQLVRRTLKSDGRQVIDLGANRPGALHSHGTIAYLSEGNRILMADFAKPRPTAIPLFERKGVTKPYDLFVHDQDTLLAVNNTVRPISADTFQLDAAGALRHVAAWQMPGVKNGSYRFVTLSQDSAAESVLYAIVPYGPDDIGHDLVAFPFRNGKAVYPEGFVLQNGRPSGVALLQEYVKDERRLLSGTRFSDWTGLGFLPGTGGGTGRIVIAAHNRGLLLFPLDRRAGLPLSARVEAVELPYHCRDLVIFGDLVIALLDPDVRMLGILGPFTRFVTLRWDGQKLRRLGEISVSGFYRGFVH